MKNAIFFLIFTCTFIQSYAQASVNKEINPNLIKNVVLINTNPWEVLMNAKGDIFSKLSQKPKYLYNYEDKSDDYQYAEMGAEAESSFNNQYTSSNVENTTPNEYPRKVLVPLDEREIEINFKKGNATIGQSEVAILDNLAQVLQNNPNKKFKIFSFNDEPASKSYILSKRRIDATLKYLNIKGIDTDQRLVIGNSVNGKSNKIVFLPID